MNVSTVSDESALLHSVAKGNELAFKTLYHLHARKIYLFAFKLLRSPILAEEVVQEVMLKLWRLENEITEINNLESYLRTSAKNIALNVLRRQEIESRAAAKLRLNWREDHNETEESVILNETRKILEEAIALLPTQQREVYRLCHQQGLKYEDAAQKLKLSPATVATHMKLALRALRNHLQKNATIIAILIIFKLA